jgi:hypothetical protein
MTTLRPDLLAAAGHLVRVQYIDNRSMQRASYRAEEFLQRLPFKVEDGALCVASASQQGQEHRTFKQLDGAMYCTCDARKPTVCWHIAAYWIVACLDALCVPLPHESWQAWVDAVAGSSVDYEGVEAELDSIFGG